MDDAAIARADSSTIQRGVEQGRRVAQWIGTGKDLRLPSDLRHQLSAASHAVAIEHHIGIIETIARFCIGSAFALVRCQLDAYVQGLYVSECLADDKVQKFVDDRSGPSTATMRRAVTKVPKIKGSALATIFRDHGSALNSYTHGGMYQLTRRLRSGSVEPTYAEMEVIEVLAFANSIALCSWSELLGLARRRDLQPRVAKRLAEDAQEWRDNGLLPIG